MTIFSVEHRTYSCYKNRKNTTGLVFSKHFDFLRHFWPRVTQNKLQTIFEAYVPGSWIFQVYFFYVAIMNHPICSHFSHACVFYMRNALSSTKYLLFHCLWFTTASEILTCLMTAHKSSPKLQSFFSRSNEIAISFYTYARLIYLFMNNIY